MIFKDHKEIIFLVVYLSSSFVSTNLMTLDNLLASKVVANALGFNSMNLVIDDQKVFSLDIMKTIYESSMLTTVTGFNKNDTRRWYSKEENRKCPTFTFLTKTHLQHFFTTLSHQPDFSFDSFPFYIWSERSLFNFSRYSFGLDSEINIILTHGNRTDVKEIYRTAKESNLITNIVGDYVVGNNFKLNEKKWKRRRNLFGLTLKTIMLEQQVTLK